MRRMSGRWRVKRFSWMDWRLECVACFKLLICKFRFIIFVSDFCLRFNLVFSFVSYVLLFMYGIVFRLVKFLINWCEFLRWFFDF